MPKNTVLKKIPADRRTGNSPLVKAFFDLLEARFLLAKLDLDERALLLTRDLEKASVLAIPPFGNEKVKRWNLWCSMAQILVANFSYFPGIPTFRQFRAPMSSKQQNRNKEYSAEFLLLISDLRDEGVNLSCIRELLLALRDVLYNMDL